MSGASHAERLKLLRASRVKPERTTAVAPMIEVCAADLARLERRLGGVSGALAETCPATLARKASIGSLSRGVLTIVADDASARFELDRWLRAGGERELVKRCLTTVRKVRLMIATGVTGHPPQATQEPAASDASNRPRRGLQK